MIENEKLVEARVVQAGQMREIGAGLIGTPAISGFALAPSPTVEGNRTPALPPSESAH